MEAEFLARLFLRLTGWQVLASSYAAHGGEIDVIARRGALIIFVEVKARQSRDAALLAIDGRKIARLSKAARHWLARHPTAQTYALRGDAILMVPWRWPERVEGAFELDL
jgi:putative endonuclease